MADIIIKNGYILTMDDSTADIPNGMVVVENGCITELGTSTSQTAPKVIDARGGIIMPGLVNTHGHLAMTRFRGFADDMPLKEWLEDNIWPKEAKLCAEDVRIGCQIGCLEMIRSGTTAFADMYFFMEETAKVVKEMGLRANLCYGLIDLGNMEKAESELASGRNFARAWNGEADGRIQTSYGPHAPYSCSRYLLDKVAEAAMADNLKIQIHILETCRERDDCLSEHGKGVVEYLNSFLGSNILAAHCVWVSDQDIEQFSKLGVKVSHNPVSNMKLASGIAPVAKMLAAGVHVSLGTDGCASNNNLSMFEEMKMAALLQKVATGDPTALSARTVLGMATVNGAEALGINSGRLKVGCNADIIIVDTNAAHLTPIFDVPSHLVYAASRNDVVTSIVDGRVLMENREIIGVDEEEILQRMKNSIVPDL